MTETTTNHYDVVIAGGGPAGSTTAYLLATFGYNVLILDKQKFPRNKLCGGLTTHKTTRLLERIFHESEDSLLEKGIINYSSSRYELRNKNKFLADNEVELPFHFVKRIVYDDFLLNKTREAGVTVIDGDGVVAYDLDENSVLTASGNTYYGRIIVGADGANSRLRREYPKNRVKYQTRWKHNVCSCFEFFVDKNDPVLAPYKNQVDHPILVFGAVNMGYAWVFPRQDDIVIGLGGMYRKNRGTLYQALLEHAGNFGIKDPRKYNLKADTVPAGSHMKRPFFKNTLLVGDAGGVVDPLLGEGIFFGQRSAELAAWTIHRHFKYGNQIGHDYPKLLWKYVYSEFINYKILRFLGFYVSEKLGHIPTGIFFRTIPGLAVDVLHGIRTSKGMFKRGDYHERTDL